MRPLEASCHGVCPQVVLRIRPLSDTELDEGATVIAHKVGDQVRLLGHRVCVHRGDLVRLWGCRVSVHNGDPVWLWGHGACVHSWDLARPQGRGHMSTDRVAIPIEC